MALTSLGIVELRAGRPEAALEALLRASLIEPRYARAHVYWPRRTTELGREPATLEELARDGNGSQRSVAAPACGDGAHGSAASPVDAWDEAREALVRLPFAKSLNAVADNQRGVANVGEPLGFMGLENWARSTA